MSDEKQKPHAEKPYDQSDVLTVDDERTYVRMDFRTRVLKTEEETGMIWMEIVPDPRRYQEVIRNGRKLWVDKYFNEALSEESLTDLARQCSGVPLSHLPRHIDDAVAYTEDRRRALATEMVIGEHIPPAEKLERHSIVATTPAKRSMTFLSIDICDSTALQAKFGETYDRCFEFFFREMVNAVAQFSGRIFKPTGDGLIAYIDTPSINTQCDAAIDMGLTLLRVLNDAVNPMLERNGLQTLQMRVGAEHGLARVKALSVPSIDYYAPEITADALNRAVKVEKTCEPNTFRIGETLYRRIHVQWLERAQLTTSDISAMVGMAGYRVYLIR